MNHTLRLILTHRWYDEIAAGRKGIEYRKVTDHWLRRIWARRDEITHVEFRRGYTGPYRLHPVFLIDVGSCPIEGWGGIYFRIHFFQNTFTEYTRSTAAQPQPSYL